MPDDLPSRAGTTFDLVVVGGGVAGLSAAYYWLTDVDPDARILIVEQSEELGGPARQHTFEVDGHRLLAPGGAQELSFPSSFPPPVRTALVDLGIDTGRFYDDAVAGHYTSRGAGGHGFAFAAEVWGRSHTAVFRPDTGGDFGDAPVSPPARAQIAALITAPTDWLAGRTDEEKLAELRTHSCDGLLREFAALDDDVHRFLRFSTSPHSGLAFDQHPALDAALIGYVGLDGIDVEGGGDGAPWKGLTHTGTRFFAHRDPPIFRFPDGNATVARALAHRLVPDLFAATSVDERLGADMATEALDRPGNQVRILLGTAAVELRRDGPDRVVVRVEARDGTTATHRAPAAVVATGAHDAARLVTGLDPEQRATAEALGRFPIVSATVALRNWRAWPAIGVNTLSWPGHPSWQIASLGFPVRMGGFEPPSSPDAPNVVTTLGGLTTPGRPPSDGAAEGRRRLASPTARAELRAELRRLLAEALAPGGFDADRDIAEVRVELWPQGYARYSTSLDGPDDEGRIGPGARERLADGTGPIAVVGVDVVDHPFLDGAMESAHRAVHRIASGPKASAR